MIFIIPCGDKKAITESRAMYLYQGNYFKANLRWALRKSVRITNIYILSAKHGLIRLTDKIAPYNLRMTEKEGVPYEYIEAQAKALGILNEKVVAVGGKPYLDRLRLVFLDLKTPFEGLPLGKSIGAVNNDRTNYYE